MEDEYRVVLLDHGKHISHSKGHIKKKESKLEAAIRELKEETALSLKEHSSRPVYDFKYNLKQRRKKRIKKVYYYAGITQPDEIQISKEHKRYLILVPSHAMDTLTYPDDREALEMGLEWLKLKL